jgi:L-lactate dehydrogenase
MKVGIVGSGMVGATAGYALIMRGVGREIVLVDKNRERAAADADDLRHAVPFAHAMEVHPGDFPDLVGCKAVFLCAGVGQKPGESRLSLLQRNAAIFRDILPAVIRHAPDAVLIVATNPVDVMTHLATSIAADHGLPKGRVLGTGTTLDTARFRSLIGTHFGIDSHHVHGYVVGEHGDSEVLTWSLATIGGISLTEFAQLRGIAFDDEVRATIDEKVRRAAYTIIQGKGATYYGIGSAMARIAEAVLKDQRSILTVCAPESAVAGVREVTLALPRLVGGAGVLQMFQPPLSELEQKQLQASAAVIRTALDKLGIAA